METLKDLGGPTAENVIVVYAYTEAIVETVREPLVILDKDLRVKTANKAFFDTFKTSKKDTYNKSIFKIGDGQWNIPALKKHLKETLPKSKAFNDFEVTHTFEDIGEKTMLLNARRIVLEGHETQMILLAIEDITKRKKLDELKDDFVGMVSHELKTPLTSIKLYVQTLHKYNEKKQDSRNTSVLKKISDQASQMDQTISSFMNAHAVQTGTLELQKQHFSIEELVTESLEAVDDIAQTHSIERQGEVSANIYADREKIRQVIANLLSNAAKYSPRGSKIVFKTAQDNRNVTISVQDFGLGISEDNRKHIFDKFFRVRQKRNKEVEGSGLGLYISSEIVKQHKGKIWVESTVGKGSTFFISLPLAKK